MTPHKMRRLRSMARALSLWRGTHDKNPSLASPHGRHIPSDDNDDDATNASTHPVTSSNHTARHDDAGSNHTIACLLHDLQQQIHLSWQQQQTLENTMEQQYRRANNNNNNGQSTTRHELEGYHMDHCMALERLARQRTQWMELYAQVLWHKSSGMLQKGSHGGAEFVAQCRKEMKRVRDSNRKDAWNQHQDHPHRHQQRPRLTAERERSLEQLLGLD